MKPQAAQKPPQFQGEGIDLRRAVLVLGLPVVAAVGVVLVLVASPVLWWIAAGVAVAGTAGGVLLRRSGRARAFARRFPGIARATAAMRRMPNGRFARTPFGRAFNRAIGRPAGGARPGGSGGHPQGLGGRLRAKLPSWAGGTRKPGPGGRPAGAGGPSAGGRPGGRARSALSRLMPGGRRPNTTASGAPGGRPTRPGSRPPGGKKPAGGLLSRAARNVGRASRATAAKLFGPPKPPAGSKPKGKDKAKGKKTKPDNSPPGTGASVDLAPVWHRIGAIGHWFGGGLRSRQPVKMTRDPDLADFEVGIEGKKVDGKWVDPEDAKHAKRAKKAAKKRAAEAPVWPNVDIDELPPPQPAWPTQDPDDVPPTASHQPRPAQEERGKRDHDPPPPRVSPPVSPSPHREAPRITSKNTPEGTPMEIKTTKQKPRISAENYAHHIQTTPDGRATGWDKAADHARSDAAEFARKADKKTASAAEFRRTGNAAAASEADLEAAALRADERACYTIAAGYQEEASREGTSAA